jgi:hypothetical protein
MRNNRFDNSVIFQIDYDGNIAQTLNTDSLIVHEYFYVIPILN